MVGVRPLSRTLCAGLLVLLAACGGSDVILEGERLPVRPDDQASDAIAPENLPAVQLTKAVTNSEWTHKNGDRTHFPGHVQGAFPLEQVWSQSIGRGASREGRITSGPIIADNLVFTLDAAASLRAFSLDGAPVWTRDLTLRGEVSLDGFGGGLAFGSGTLVAGTGFGEVVAVQPATGEIIWRQELDAPVRSSPTVSGGLVYVVSRNDQAYAIDIKNGRIRWRVAGIDPDAGVVGGASPAATSGLVVLPFASGEVVGTVARNGRRAWTAVVSGGRRGLVRSRLSDITGDPVISGDTVYVANQSGRFVALDRRSGQRKWSVNDGSLSPALPMGNSVFFVTDTAKLKRIDASDGSQLWSVQLPEYEDAEDRKGAYLHSGPVMVGGRLLVASGDGALRSFDPTTGAELGTTPIGGGGAAAQPALAGGRLFVVSRDGTLFAFQ